MIEWPQDDTEGAKKALALFKKTGFAAALQEDSRAWHFQSWARRPDAPARMILRNEAGDETRTFTLERTGYWVRSDQDSR